MEQQKSFKQVFGTEAGYIFVVTLIVLTSIAGLLVSLMQFVILETSAQKSTWLHHQDFYSLESAVKSLIKKKSAACTVFEKNPNRLMKRVLKKQRCLYRHQGKNYTYLWSDLGNMACVKSYENNQKKSTRHFWLTVASSTQTVIQIRWVEAEPDKICRLKTQTTVEIGMLSWRLSTEGALK